MTYNDYITGIATIIKDFRKGELETALGYEHVSRWISQFNLDERQIVLEEVFYALSRFYLKKERIERFLEQVVELLFEKFDSNHIQFLSIQEAGESQKQMLGFVHKICKEKYDWNISENTTPNCHVYIDDGLYNGSRARKDLLKWLNDAPNDTTLYVFFMIAFNNGYNYSEEVITRAAKEKNIKVIFKYGKMLNNNRSQAYRDKNAEISIMWPHISSNEDSLISTYSYKLIETGKANYLYQSHEENLKCELFSSPERSRYMEKIFLKYGVIFANQIQTSCYYPLGYCSTPSLGFGSVCATDLNISNTCPLVLWWGSIDDPESIPGKWYPLLPRRQNNKILEIIFDIKESFSINRIADILKTVYALALERHRKENTETIETFNFDIAELRNKHQESTLLQYLISLKLSDIKIIETVM